MNSPTKSVGTVDQSLTAKPTSRRVTAYATDVSFDASPLDGHMDSLCRVGFVYESFDSREHGQRSAG